MFLNRCIKAVLTPPRSRYSSLWKCLRNIQFLVYFRDQNKLQEIHKANSTTVFCLWNTLNINKLPWHPVKLWVQRIGCFSYSLRIIFFKYEIWLTDKILKESPDFAFSCFLCSPNQTMGIQPITPIRHLYCTLWFTLNYFHVRCCLFVSCGFWILQQTTIYMVCKHSVAWWHPEQRMTSHSLWHRT